MITWPSSKRSVTVLLAPVTTVEPGCTRWPVVTVAAALAVGPAFTSPLGFSTTADANTERENNTLQTHTTARNCFFTTASPGNSARKKLRTNDTSITAAASE